MITIYRYALEASRAVNQAVGRIIRHKNDFGGILLLDCRFHRQKNQLSGWLQKHVNRTKTFQNFGSLMASIVQFFQRNQTVRFHYKIKFNFPRMDSSMNSTFTATRRSTVYIESRK